jgi:hypothetical protein
MGQSFEKAHCLDGIGKSPPYLPRFGDGESTIGGHVCNQLWSGEDIAPQRLGVSSNLAVRAHSRLSFRESLQNVMRVHPNPEQIVHSCEGISRDGASVGVCPDLECPGHATGRRGSAEPSGRIHASVKGPGAGNGPQGEHPPVTVGDADLEQPREIRQPGRDGRPIEEQTR